MMKVDNIQTSQPNYATQLNTDYVDKKQGSFNEISSATLARRPSAQELLERQKMGETNFSVSEKAIIEAIERANKAVELINTSFEYSIHEGTKQIMVKVINKETKEVIREIPPEKILDLVAKIWELVGLFVDEKK